MNFEITINAPELAKSIMALAEAIKGKQDTPSLEEIAAAPPHVETAQKEVKPEPAPAKTPEKEAQPEQEPPAAVKEEPEKPIKEEPKPSNEGPTISLEVVRGKLTALSRAGKQKEVKAILTELGAAKLSELPEEKYAEAIEKAEAVAV